MSHLYRYVIALGIAAGLLLIAVVPARADVAPSHLFQQGVDAYQEHNYPQAIDTFTQVIQQDQASSKLLAAAYGNRCLIELELDAYRQAIADCTQGLRLNPVNTESYLNRGLAYYRVNDYTAAIRDYDKRLAYVSDDHRALYNRGLANASLERYDQALKDYSRSIGVSRELPDKRMAEIHFDRGLAYLKLEQYNSAASDFSQAIAHDNLNTEAYVNRAYAAHALGDNKMALRDLDQVLALNPAHAKAHFNLGMLHCDQGHLTGAIANFEQAARHFFAQNSMEDYRQVMTILHQLQPASALA